MEISRNDLLKMNIENKIDFYAYSCFKGTTVTLSQHNKDIKNAL